MSIDRAALPFALALLLLAAAAAWWHPAAASVPVLLLLYVLYFFRDPERHPPADPDAVISPADGRIVRVGPTHVSVFLNLFDVHVCRAPVAGTVVSAEHSTGRFVAAWRDDASEQNERLRIVLADGPRRLGFTLVAGLVARRIVLRALAGSRVAAGERIGLIRFGSRVDVDLPAGASAVVRLGERVRAGESVLARLSPEGAAPRGEEPHERGVGPVPR